MFAADDVGDVVGEIAGLAAVEGGGAVTEAGEVGEREGGRAVVDGVLLSAGDAELAGDVVGVGEERGGFRYVAAEGEVRGVVEARGETVAPAGGGAEAVTLAGISEAEEAAGFWNRGSDYWMLKLVRSFLLMGALRRTPMLSDVLGTVVMRR